ncbi:MAG: asparagine synthase (glutamine-hydrolyzing) [Telluria sp.]|nr:asparagine synthase (glutamine-hydrolyzing) [Telluria sp.]
MCGIGGVFAHSILAPPVDLASLAKVQSRMATRGPDGEGHWHSTDQRVALVHRRLAVIDLSENASQPMLSTDGRLSISFNGEIYNHRELRSELRRKGREFRSESDTEVLLQLYDEYGADMLGRLRGMFAFALWDSGRQAMLLARDTFGIKPLYYADDGRTFRFASQVKALIAGGHVDTAPQPAGHVGFFLWGSVPAPWTLYRGILALEAGHFMWVDEQGARRPQAYCTVRDLLGAASETPARGTRAEALDAIGHALRDSIAAHHVADVPVGLFLSSGIDSALIAALSTAAGEHPRTLTLGFAEYAGTAADETPLAELLAAQLGTRQATVTTRREEFHAYREALMSAMDQPSIDGINTWLVSRAAAAQGLKVALSGLGGDELFASYPSFSDVPRIQRLAQATHCPRFVGRGLRKLVAPALSRLTSPKYAGLLEYGSTIGGAYLLRRALFMPWELEHVLDPEIARQGWKALQCEAELQQTTAGISRPRLAITALEKSWYMRHQLLVDTDWASMAHSLEVRVPYLDVPLLRSVAPWLAAYPDLTKSSVARAVAPQLPAAVLNRPKTGFAVPVREWLGDPAGLKERGLRGWARGVHRAFLETHA